MKTVLSKILIVLLLLSPVLNIAASPIHNKIIITDFTGSESFVGMPDPNPGTYKYVDGKTIAKGVVVYFEDTISDSRVSGDVTATINYVYDGPPIFGKGPIWGTEHITNADGGWNVRFTGYAYGDGRVSINAHGLGEGAYEGMHADWEIQSSEYGLTATVTGSITEHDR